MQENLLNTVGRELHDIITQQNTVRTLLGVLIAAIVSYWASRFVARGIVWIGHRIAVRSDNEIDEIKTIQLRRAETYLSIFNALVRVAIILAGVFFAWEALNPSDNNSSTTVYALGAGAFIAVITGATIGIILRDITAGAVMIVENWFHVGDFIRVEPFGDVNGVVESVTLRSTKLRNINGEVIWLHNQYIQGVKITPHGLRRIAIDVFARTQHEGQDLIDRAIQTLPIGTIKVATKPEVANHEKWGENLYHFTVVGETAPGREWLLETFFIDSLKELDNDDENDQILVRPSIARYSDPIAEQSFRRAVRIHRSQSSS